jgi:hypothetical protein
VTTSKGKDLLGRMKPVDPDGDPPQPAAQPAPPAAPAAELAPAPEQPAEAEAQPAPDPAPAEQPAVQPARATRQPGSRRPRRSGGRPSTRQQPEEGRPLTVPFYLAPAVRARLVEVLEGERIELTPWVLRAYRHQRDNLAEYFGVEDPDDELPARSPRRGRITGGGQPLQLRPLPREQAVLEKRRTEQLGGPSMSAMLAAIVELELGPSPGEQAEKAAAEASAAVQGRKPAARRS